MIHRRPAAPARVDLQMTPLIDVVFQLLTFFLMSFRISAAEGDIHLLLPRDGVSLGPSNSIEDVLRVRLAARNNGDLAQLRIAEQPPLVGPHAYAELHAYAMRLVNAAHDANRPDPIVELDADDGLRYEHVLAAVTAVSRQVDDHGEVVPLVKKVKFAPR